MIHANVELFDARTRPKVIQKEMDEMGLLDGYCQLVATDTDSAHMSYTFVKSIDCDKTDVELSLWVRLTIVKMLKHKIDTSSDYFKQFDLQDLSTKKQYGKNDISFMK